MQPRMREWMAQVSIDISTACGYFVRAGPVGFVCASIDSRRDDARKRKRASVRIPGSTGCGHDWFSTSQSPPDIINVIVVCI